MVVCIHCDRHDFHAVSCPTPTTWVYSADDTKLSMEQIIEDARVTWEMM